MTEKQILRHGLNGNQLKLIAVVSMLCDHAAIRLLGSTIPNLSELGLPEAVNQFSSWNKGIILVTGETGSGKDAGGNFK
jgi:Tfp pilus assembly pilus retraction ATPase PilT